MVPLSSGSGFFSAAASVPVRLAPGLVQVADDDRSQLKPEIVCFSRVNIECNFSGSHHVCMCSALFSGAPCKHKQKPTHNQLVVRGAWTPQKRTHKPTGTRLRHIVENTTKQSSNPPPMGTTSRRVLGAKHVQVVADTAHVQVVGYSLLLQTTHKHIT